MSEIINNIEEQNQDKLVRVSFIKGILNRLKAWMPFHQNADGSIVQTETDGTSTNEVNNPNEIALGTYNLSDINTIFSLGIGEPGNRKNAVKINTNGEIFILTDINNNIFSSLQVALNDSKVIFCSTYEKMLMYKELNYVGRFLYLTETCTYDEVTYASGLYLISRNSRNESILLEISKSLDAILENYLTADEIKELIKDISIGDLKLEDYFDDIKTLDTNINELTKRVDDIEEWIDTPLGPQDINEIINK